jgi:hypothetical protein
MKKMQSMWRIHNGRAPERVESAIENRAREEK